METIGARSVRKVHTELRKEESGRSNLHDESSEAIRVEIGRVEAGGQEPEELKNDESFLDKVAKTGESPSVKVDDAKSNGSA